MTVAAVRLITVDVLIEDIREGIGEGGGRDEVEPFVLRPHREVHGTRQGHLTKCGDMLSTEPKLAAASVPREGS